MSDRELRERLEVLQARARELRAALQLPPDVASELANLEASATSLAARRDLLIQQVETAGASVASSTAVVRRVEEEQRSDFKRAFSERTQLLLASLATGFVGVVAGVPALYWWVTLFGDSALAWAPSGLLGGAWVWLLYRLGKAA